MLGESEWQTKKRGAVHRRQWRTVHLDVEATTLEIQAMEVTDNSTGDALMLPKLLGQIPLDEHVTTVAGNGAYFIKRLP